MTWRDSIAKLREAEDAACNHANHANPWPVVGSDSHDSHDCKRSATDSGSSSTPADSHDSHDCTQHADDSQDVDQVLEVADLIRRSGVEGLAVADLDADTALNLVWFARLGTAARPGLRIWFKALAAAKRHPAGLGISSAPVGHEVMVGVARRGAWSRLLSIERETFSPFGLVELLQRLAPDVTLSPDA